MLCWFQGCSNDSRGGIFVNCTYLDSNQITFSADSVCFFPVVMHRVFVCPCVHSRVCHCGCACARSWCGRVYLCVSLCVAGVCQCVWVLACLVAVLLVSLLPRLFACMLGCMLSCWWTCLTHSHACLHSSPITYVRSLFVKCIYLEANQIPFSADSGCLFAAVMHRVSVCLCVHSHVCYCGCAHMRLWCLRVYLCVSLCAG